MPYQRIMGVGMSQKSRYTISTFKIFIRASKAEGQIAKTLSFFSVEIFRVMGHI